jgi:hypothetical protein
MTSKWPLLDRKGKVGKNYAKNNQINNNLWPLQTTWEEKFSLLFLFFVLAQHAQLFPIGYDNYFIEITNGNGEIKLRRTW